MNAALKSTLEKRRFAGAWLERLGSEIDLSDAQLELARARYQSVGEWLAGSPNSWLHGSSIFAQGSVALKTAKKPVGRDEVDVDLVQHLKAAPPSVPPSQIKGVVGARLREHATYRAMLEEMPRCWRLNYSGAFHLDITPAVWHVSAPAPALLVPDKRLERWMPSNPIGYRELFERRAALRARMILARADGITADSVEAFPIQLGAKGPLRRIVQLLKHHRDLWFQPPQISDLKPISIIITTLAAQSYERAVASGIYDTEYDLVVAVLEGMPDYIQVISRTGATFYSVPNETVEGENFAEKWNRDPRLAQAFSRWHQSAVSTLTSLLNIEGMDLLAEYTSRHFGTGIGQRVLEKFTHNTSAARTSQRLTVGPAVGLTTSALASTPIRSNTFFGRPE
jgi:hypothetical protein